MNKLLTPSPTVGSWLAGLAVFALAGSSGWAEEQEDWMRHFRVGAVVALNTKAKFSMGGQFGISGNAAGTAGTGGNHTYDDGYVRVDQTGTEYTSYWGYNSGSQYDAQTLTYHSTKSFSLGGSSASESEPQAGLDLAYGGDLGRWASGWYGWELGFSFLPTKTVDSRPLAATFSRTVHRYNTGDILLPEGPYNGGDSGQGPNIPNNATALPDDNIFGTITGTRSLEVFIYNLRLGPTLCWELRPHFAVQISGGPAIAYASATYNFKETIRLQDGSRTRNSGSFGNDEILYGGYFGALLMYHATEAADIYVGAQFMSLSSITVNGPGRKAELDLSAGIYLSAGVNWPF